MTTGPIGHARQASRADDHGRRAVRPRDLLPFSPPSAAEQEALRRAAAYLKRAGNEVASRALMPDLVASSGWAGGRDGGGAARSGLAALQESLRAAASLCAGVVETAGDGDGTAGEGTAGERERTSPSPAVPSREVGR